MFKTLKSYALESRNPIQVVVLLCLTHTAMIFLYCLGPLLLCKRPWIKEPDPAILKTPPRKFRPRHLSLEDFGPKKSTNQQIMAKSGKDKKNIDLRKETGLAH